jgi:hypothetical protein
MAFLLTYYTECWHLLYFYLLPATKYASPTITPHHYCTTCTELALLPPLHVPVLHSDVLQLGSLATFTRVWGLGVGWSQLLASLCTILIQYLNSWIRALGPYLTFHGTAAHKTNFPTKKCRLHSCALISTTTECAGNLDGLGKYPILSCRFCTRISKKEPEDSIRGI